MSGKSRTQNTIEYLKSNPQVFDRITKDETGGRVGWSVRMPRNYDNKKGLAWSLVRGRYWYPWVNAKTNDEQAYREILEKCDTLQDSTLYDPDELVRYAQELESRITSGEVSRSPESDPDSDEYEGIDYVFELRSSAARIRRGQ
jgi:hypothetical protein